MTLGRLDGSCCAATDIQPDTAPSPMLNTPDFARNSLRFIRVSPRSQPVRTLVFVFVMSLNNYVHDCPIRDLCHTQQDNASRSAGTIASASWHNSADLSRIQTDWPGMISFSLLLEHLYSTLDMQKRIHHFSDPKQAGPTRNQSVWTPNRYHKMLPVYGSGSDYGFARYSAISSIYIVPVPPTPTPPLLPRPIASLSTLVRLIP